MYYVRLFRLQAIEHSRAGWAPMTAWLSIIYNEDSRICGETNMMNETRCVEIIPMTNIFAVLYDMSNSEYDHSLLWIWNHSMALLDYKIL